MTGPSVAERLRLIAEFDPTSRSFRKRKLDDGNVAVATAAAGLMDLLSRGAVRVLTEDAPGSALLDRLAAESFAEGQSRPSPLSHDFIVAHQIVALEGNLASAAKVVAGQRKPRSSSWYLLHLNKTLRTFDRLDDLGLTHSPRPRSLELTDQGVAESESILRGLAAGTEPLLAEVLVYGSLAPAVERNAGPLAVRRAANEQLPPGAPFVLRALARANQYSM